MQPDSDKVLDEYSGMISRGMAEDISKRANAAKAAKSSIEDIISGRIPNGTTVDIEGNIYRVFSKASFLKDGKEDFYRIMVLGDEPNTVRVTLWRRQADLVDTLMLERGDRVLARNLVVSEWKGTRSLAGTNATMFFRLRFSDSGIVNYSKLAPNSKNVDIIGKVIEVGPIKNFISLSGRQSGVSYCILTNGQSNIRAVLWDTASAYASAIKPGDYIKIEFASAKQGSNGIEMHVGSDSRILISDKLRGRLTML